MDLAKSFFSAVLGAFVALFFAPGSLKEFSATFTTDAGGTYVGEFTSPLSGFVSYEVTYKKVAEVDVLATLDVKIGKNPSIQCNGSSKGNSRPPNNIVTYSCGAYPVVVSERLQETFFTGGNTEAPMVTRKFSYGSALCNSVISYFCKF